MLEVTRPEGFKEQQLPQFNRSAVVSGSGNYNLREGKIALFHCGQDDSRV
jgi:hypothetical protein